jgi:AcrR family transcriptional regulator
MKFAGKRRDTDMAKKTEEKKPGNRIPLYTEIGKYFTADGSFDERIFRKNLGEMIPPGRDRDGKDGDRSFHERLSCYLTEILAYLLEKDMPRSAWLVFRAAVAETKRLGLKNLSLSPEHLDFFLSSPFPENVEAEKERPTRDEKKDKIFRAALDVFEKEGFRRATMDRIAQGAGIGKASVYRMFNNKEELMEQLLDEHYGEIVRAINEINSRSINILEQIREMIEFWVDYISRNPVIYLLIQTESNSQGTGNKVVFYYHLTSSLPMFKEHIVSMNRKNMLKTINFYTVFYGVLGYIDGVVIKWFKSGMNYDLRDEIPEILEVLFRGFVKDKAP